MRYHFLCGTGLEGHEVSTISFGAGPVSGLMTGDNHELQFATVAAAIEAGINWFDTAPGYGHGSSETNLGRVLSELKTGDDIHIATKVRIPANLNEPIADYVRRSVEESLRRLRRSHVALLQLHNGLTERRGDEPDSIAPEDVLGPNGVVTAFRKVQEEGLVQFVGLTGTGHSSSMRAVIRSGQFDTIQAPFNMLNPSAGSEDPPPAGETNYGNIFDDCLSMRMWVFAIRVYAGGALLGQPPSAHTLKTPYFPLALYERDAMLAQQIRDRVATRMTMPEAAVKFVLWHPAVQSAIIGFGSPEQVREVVSLNLDETIFL